MSIEQNYIVQKSSNDIGDNMCCGGSKNHIRVQIVPQQTQTQSVKTQSVRLVPPSTLRVFVNNQKTGEKSVIQSVGIQSATIRREELEKCPICSHTVMIQKVGGRPRKQCTNFACRNILE